jgi:hypothetical protein
MKIATVAAILATVITTTEGKKSKTSGDWRSKDGDPHAAKWGSKGWGSNGWRDDDDWWGWPDKDDWWSSDNDDWWGWSGKSGKSSSGDWGKGNSWGWSGKSGKSSSGDWGKGKGSWDSAFYCKYKTCYIDVSKNGLLDGEGSNDGGIRTTYDNYALYKSISNVGSDFYDGVVSYQRVTTGKNSCQGHVILGVNGVGPIYKDQIYVTTTCDPDNGNMFITDGGITGGLGYYALATGTMTFIASGDLVGKLKYWYCLPYGVERSWWGGSSWGDSWDSWGHGVDPWVESSSSWDSWGH